MVGTLFLVKKSDSYIEMKERQGKNDKKKPRECTLLNMGTIVRVQVI